MKAKLLNRLIFLLITPLTISTTVLLFLTFLSTTKFSNNDIVPKDESMFNLSPEHFREYQRINLIETEFKAYTVSKIERNNMEIFTINEEINDTKPLIEVEINYRNSDLIEQSSKLNKYVDN